MVTPIQRANLMPAMPAALPARQAGAIDAHATASSPAMAGFQPQPVHHHENTRARAMLAIAAADATQHVRPAAELQATGASARLPDLADELVLMIMQHAGEAAANLAEAGKRYSSMLANDFREILFPHRATWASALLQALQRRIDSEPAEPSAADAAFAGSAAPDALTGGASARLTCGMILALVEQGEQHFTDDNLPRLKSLDGFRQAKAHYAFLGHLGAGNGASLFDQTTFDELGVIRSNSRLLPIGGFSRSVPQHAGRVRYGLLRFLNALSASRLPFSVPGTPARSMALATTQAAYELADEAFMAFIEQPGSPWFEPGYPQQNTRAAIALRNPRINDWILRPGSTWVASGAAELAATVAAFELGNEALTAWIIKEDSPWMAMQANSPTRDPLQDSYTVRVVTLGDAQLTQWLLADDSPWPHMSQDTQRETTSLFEHRNELLTRMVMRNTTADGFQPPLGLN